MPRRRPAAVRNRHPRHRAAATRPDIDGLSARAQSEIHRLEQTRNHLGPGDVRAAVRLWQDYVHRPERRLWHDYEWGGGVHEYCCDDPFEARALLDTVMRAMAPRKARELRQVVSRLDTVWNRRSPPYGGG